MHLYFFLKTTVIFSLFTPGGSVSILKPSILQPVRMYLFSYILFLQPLHFLKYLF